MLIFAVLSQNSLQNLSTVLIFVNFEYQLILKYIKTNKEDKEMAQNMIRYCKVIIIITLSGDAKQMTDEFNH